MCPSDFASTLHCWLHVPHPGNPCPRGLKQWRGKTLVSCLGEDMTLLFRLSFRPIISFIVTTSASYRRVLLARRKCHVSPLVSCMQSSLTSVHLWEACLLCDLYACHRSSVAQRYSIYSSSTVCVQHQRPSSTSSHSSAAFLLSVNALSPSPLMSIVNLLFRFFV